jgi:hypothetical protein
MTPTHGAAAGETSTQPGSTGPASFLAFGTFDYVFTQTLLATHPQILVIK